MSVSPFEQPAYALGSASLISAGDIAETLGALLAGMDPWLRGGRTAADLAARFRQPGPGGHGFAILVDGAVVGALIVRYPFMRGPYLETLGLVDTVRGRGVGGEVIAWMESEARGHAGNIWLCVSDWNLPARSFYTRRGFVEVGPLPDLVNDGDTEIFMRKQLTG